MDQNATVGASTGAVDQPTVTPPGTPVSGTQARIPSGYQIPNGYLGHSSTGTPDSTKTVPDSGDAVRSSSVTSSPIAPAPAWPFIPRPATTAPPTRQPETVVPSAPPANPTTITEPAAPTEPTPATKPAPPTEATPITEATPVTEPATPAEPTPVTKPTPATEAIPPTEATPVAEPTAPTESVSASEPASPVVPAPTPSAWDRTPMPAWESTPSATTALSAPVSENPPEAPWTPAVTDPTARRGLPATESTDATRDDDSLEPTAAPHRQMLADEESPTPPSPTQPSPTLGEPTDTIAQQPVTPPPPTMLHEQLDIPTEPSDIVEQPSIAEPPGALEPATIAAPSAIVVPPDIPDSSITSEPLTPQKNGIVAIMPPAEGSRPDLPDTPTESSAVIAPLDTMPALASEQPTPPSPSTPRFAAERHDDGGKKTDTSTRVLIIVLIVAIIIAAAGLAAYFIPRLRTEPGAATSPTAAVQAYLSALASGDATTALTYSAAQPSNTTYLTNDFLSQMMAVHPISAVIIPEGQPTQSPATIHATYSLGETNVDAQFTVQQYDRKWLLDGGYLTLDLSSLKGWGLPLTLNGVDLGESNTVQIFPGVYTLTLTDSPMLDLANPNFTIAYPEANPTFDQMSLTLSEDGQSRIRTAANQKLTQCVASHELQPSGCGFGFAGAESGTVDPATVTWTLQQSSDLATVALTLDGSSTTVALGDIAATASIHAVSTDGRHNYTGDSSVTKLRADFTDPDNIQVTFGAG